MWKPLSLAIVATAIGLLVMASESAGALCGSGFQPGVSFAAGDRPEWVAAADVDGDTDLDLVTANETGDDVSVLLGNGDGTFQAAASFAAGDAPNSVAVGHLDGDTALDLVTANEGSSDVSVLLGNGDGTFQAATSFAAGDSPLVPLSVAVADLDGDTVPDVVTANADLLTPSTDSGSVSVLLGNGDGSFQAAVSILVGDGPLSVAGADLDGDTVPDLVTANFFDGGVSVLMGNGDGTFQAAAFFLTGMGPESVAVADLDGDTVPDLATANVGNFDVGDVSVLLGNGDGTFQAAASFLAGEDPYRVAVADLDGDTFSDIVTVNATSRDVSVLLGNGDGTFQAPVSFTAGFFPRSVAVADLDADTAPDLVTTNVLDEVTVLINLCEAGSEFDVPAFSGWGRAALTALLVGGAGAWFATRRRVAGR